MGILWKERGKKWRILTSFHGVPFLREQIRKSNAIRWINQSSFLRFTRLINMLANRREPFVSLARRDLISVCCAASFFFSFFFFPNARSFVFPIHCVTSVCAAQIKALPGWFLLLSLSLSLSLCNYWLSTHLEKAPRFVLLDRTHVGGHSIARPAPGGSVESFVDPQRSVESRAGFNLSELTRVLCVVWQTPCSWWPTGCRDPSTSKRSSSRSTSRSRRPSWPCRRTACKCLPR